MGNFFGSPAKNLIRKNWNKPLLKFFNENLGYKLVYLGLPSPNAEDIMEWIDYIEYIIAFQCRDYPKPSAPDQDRTYVIKLESKILELERQKKIISGYVYDGYIEEVIAKGEDNMKVKFSQDRFITVYNLDFCNQITSPLQVINHETGEIKEVYKLHTLRELLHIQSKKEEISKKFVMFLTFHSGFWDDEAKSFVESTESAAIVKYFEKITSLNGIQKKIRLLKSYVFDTLKNYFRDFNFVPEFLPVINYSAGKEWLLHFTIIGTSINSVGRVNCPQNPENFLEQKFITVNNKNKLGFLTNLSLGETEYDINSVELFKNSKTFKLYWV